MKASSSLIVRQIKAEDDTKNAIGYLADLIVEIEQARCDENEKILDEVKELSTHIKGNGNPEKGLLHRFSRLEDRLQTMVWVGSAVVLIVLGWLINSLLGLI